MGNVAKLHAARHNDANRIVAKNIKAELGYNDLSQKALANALGLSEMAISRRLGDNTEFTATEIFEAARFFGIEPGALFKERGGNMPAINSVGPTGIEPMTSTV